MNTANPATRAVARETLALAAAVEARRAELTLTQDQDDALLARQWQLLHAAAEMATVAVTERIMELEASGALAGVRAGTTAALEALRTLEDVKSVIDAASRAAELAGAVVTGDVLAIARAVQHPAK